MNRVTLSEQSEGRNQIRQGPVHTVCVSAPVRHIASVTPVHDCCAGGLSSCPAFSGLLAKHFSPQSGGKLEEEEQFQKCLPISATENAEWESPGALSCKHIKLGPEHTRKGEGGWQFCCYNTGRQKALIFRTEEPFHSYNIEEKPKLGQLKREE